MVISHKHRFIFVHIPKAAGTSLTQLLKRYAGRGVWTKVRALAVQAGLARDEGFAPHESAKSLRDKLPSRVFDGYLKFAFVRNPWDWHVSHYHYVRVTPEHPNHAMFNDFPGFDEYVDWIVDNGYLQHQLLADEGGRILMDFVGRFETLEADLHQVLGLLGIPPIPLARLNPSGHRDYRSYYTERTRALIGDARQLDVEAFGYDFDGLRETGVVRAFSSRIRDALADPARRRGGSEMSLER